MTCTRRIPRSVLSTLLMASSSISLAQAPFRGYPITSGDVRNSLEQLGVHLPEQQIQIPAGREAMNERPQFRFSEATVVEPSQVRVRCACEAASSCQPFVVTLEIRGGDASPQFIVDRLSPATSQPGNSRGHATPPTLQAGHPTTLHIISSHGEVVLPVIAIDTGSLGTNVRVVSPNRKNVYHGVVDSQGQVRGVLP